MTTTPVLSRLEAVLDFNAARFLKAAEGDRILASSMAEVEALVATDSSLRARWLEVARRVHHQDEIVLSEAASPNLARPDSSIVTRWACEVSLPAACMFGTLMIGRFFPFILAGFATAIVVSYVTKKLWTNMYDMKETDWAVLPPHVSDMVSNAGVGSIIGVMLVIVERILAA